MIIGGIQKTSLIDFPDKISCVIFTAGCNFTCPYCHNPELVSPPFSTIEPEEIFTFLKKRISLLDGVVITGGEPTLHNDLPEFCDAIKSMGFAVKLDTNGSRPHMLYSLINKCQVDYLAMDLKTRPEKYPNHLAPGLLPEAILQSMALIRDSGIPHEFRTTCTKPFVDAPDIREMAALIRGADLFVLQRAQISDAVLSPEFFENLDWQYSMSELENFQAVAAPFVKNALIR